MSTTSATASVRSLADAYFDQGYVFPLDVVTREQARDYRQQLEELESRAGASELGNKGQLNHPHVIFRFAHEIVTHPTILDVVEAILGPDLLVWGSTFFIKEPQSESYVSWHQDLRYWGLDGDAQVSAWIALSPVTEENGCMKFIPGSHRLDLLPHHDSLSRDNFLTRGQEVTGGFDESEAVNVCLEPGQASFHHGHLLHSSGPNRSDQRRVGLTINYIAADMRQVAATEDFAMLVRGKDRFGHFQRVPPPARDLDEEAMAWHHRILSAQNEALYEGAPDTKGRTM